MDPEQCCFIQLLACDLSSSLMFTAGQVSGCLLVHLHPRCLSPTGRLWHGGSQPGCGWLQIFFFFFSGDAGCANMWGLTRQKRITEGRKPAASALEGRTSQV